MKVFVFCEHERQHDWPYANIFVGPSILIFVASSDYHESNYYPFQALVEKKFVQSNECTYICSQIAAQ